MGVARATPCATATGLVVAVTVVAATGAISTVGFNRKASVKMGLSNERLRPPQQVSCLHDQMPRRSAVLGTIIAGGSLAFRNSLASSLSSSVTTTPPQISFRGSSGRVFDYSEDGDNGLKHWDSFSSLCSSGKRQSPVDIHLSLLQPTSSSRNPFTLDEILPSSSQSPMISVVAQNTGRGIQFNLIGDSESAISFRRLNSDTKTSSSSFRLNQFHMHHPSEHTISGCSYPLELHFVHSDDDGKVVVVAVLADYSSAERRRNNEQSTSTSIAGDSHGISATFPPSLLKTLPLKMGSTTNPTAVPRKSLRNLYVLSNINREDANGRKSSPRSYVTYEGSLTTPPCSEDVRWFVSESILLLPDNEMDALLDVMERAPLASQERMGKATNRPTQPMNGRELSIGTIIVQ
mmetsp:Transcript_27136/g.65982  ORF Transcript_27136/g.65982 Transcript_27136/m.65982 type:complete len:405 (-) Transcript_27136:26-1240(-)